MSNQTLAQKSMGGKKSLSLLQKLWHELPQGRPLPEATWQRRHAGIIVLLYAHAVGLVALGFFGGEGFFHSLLEGSIPAIAAFFAQQTWFSRRVRGGISGLGLIAASAILIHFAGGFVEMHFHFFVMIIVISLYQDWIPLLLTLAYVVVHHGFVGVLFPKIVYNHPEAWEHPWAWALIHGGFVLAASVASILNWRLNEQIQLTNEQLLQAAGDGICGINEAGEITFANPAAASLLGRTVEELQGLPIRQIMPQDAVGQVMGAVRQGTSLSLTNVLLNRQDRSTFSADFQAEPLLDRGQTTGAVLTLRDMSERQQAEAERVAVLEEQQQAREQIIALQQTQIANLSTPLLPISEGVVVMPLVGGIDAERGALMVEFLGQGIEAYHPRTVILDLTGGQVEDAAAGQLLVQAAHMTRLLGAELILTGIRPALAQLLVGLGMELGAISTHSTLQQGVQYALQAQRKR